MDVLPVLPRCECVISKDFRETPASSCTECDGYGITKKGIEMIEPGSPCPYVAGSLEKVTWIMLRRFAGLDLRHLDDNPLQKKKAGGIPKPRYGTADEYRLGELTHAEARQCTESTGSTHFGH